MAAYRTTNKHDVVNGFDFAALPVKVDYVGRVNDKEWPHFLWTVTLTHKGGFYTTQYRTGLGHVAPKRHGWSEEIPQLVSGDIREADIDPDAPDWAAYYAKCEAGEASGSMSEGVEGGVYYHLGT